MGLLVLVYWVQTGWLWADPSPHEPLTGAALDGASLWHTHNCQACHQVYGYGGFIGPDLTNAAGLHGPDGLSERLAAVLSEGPGAMPVIPATSEEVAALAAFLVALDATGQGQARAPAGETRADRFDAAVRERLPASGAVARGYGLYAARPCGACHAPLAEGSTGAPDLSGVAERLSPEDLARVLAEGRLPRMPPTGLSPDERADLAAWLAWLGEHREGLVADVEAPSELALAELPWWEFE